MRYPSSCTVSRKFWVSDCQGSSTEKSGAPFILIISISHYLLTHKDAPWVKNVFAALRPAIIGLIAAAALLLMNKENFGTPSASLPLFVLSITLCIAVFFATLRFKVNPILAMLICGIIGLIAY